MPGSVSDPATPRYTVFVDDNYHFMDERERYTLGEFDDYASAVAACKRIVDEYPLAGDDGSQTAEELYDSYVAGGEDPFIIPPGTLNFSAWTYAREQCYKIADRQSG